jgi:predicted HNH restriction endonuclease
MKRITDLRVWKSATNEYRVYVTYNDKTEGCYYLTGNRYQAKGMLLNMSLEEKKQALEISEKKHGENKWGSVRYWEINPETSKVVNTYNSYKRIDKEDEEDADVRSRGFRESRTPNFEECFA